MNFVTATARFIEQANYLTDEHLPIVSTMQAIAIDLDQAGRLSAAMLSEYMKATKYLIDCKPPAAEAVGEIEAFLAANSK